LTVGSVPQGIRLETVAASTAFQKLGSDAKRRSLGPHLFLGLGSHPMKNDK
jgi:hypothetical protein